MSVQGFSHSVPARTAAPRVPGKRCCHCRRELTSGEGQLVEFVGVLGPECVKKYASLIAALGQVNGLEAYEWDHGTVVLANYVIWKLRAAGVAVKVVDVKDGVKAVQIVGLSRKPAAVVQSWEERRAEFEAELKRAELERGEEGAA